MCCCLTTATVTQLSFRDQAKKSALLASESSNKLSLAEADFQLEVTRLKAQITSITKEKEELSDLLEDTSRAKMMCETDLHRLQENWEKENEEFHINIFNQLKNDLLARNE